jgi:tRNA threonylcarbamoyladenosine biosynthesis protein TsaB
VRVLAIDTALEACSAAVLDTGVKGGLTSRSLPMMRGHAEALMPMVAAVMSAAGTEFADLDRIAVTVGPGSFTGLRVGIAAARGFALAAGKTAVGLTTLATLAAPFFDVDDSKALLAAIDARHGRVYMQLFGPGGRIVVAPRLAEVGEAVKAAAANPTRIVGPGAKLIEAAWPHDIRRPLQVAPVRAPDIGWIARLGAALTETSGGVRPLYLHGPGAKPQQSGILPRR